MGKRLKRYKVGLDSETMAISMVSEPAIEVDFIHMSKDEERKQIFLEKDEKYMVYGPVLIPDVDIYRNNGEQEYYLSFTKESIEKMSQEYMKDFKQYNVSLQHEEQVDEVCMVESWVVMDSYKDKANALGFNVPEGTWMAAFKVNNIDTWNRIKEGELKGFSVESMISLEEFSKNDNNMINVDEMSFWTRMKEVLEECFSSPKVEEPAEIEPTNIELEEQPQAEPQPTAQETVVENGDPAVVTPKAEEPKVEEPVVEEPKAEEPKAEEAPKVEEPKDNHLEELINNLKEEIAALKEMNTGLQEKINDMGKEPSVQPVNVNAKPNGAVNDASGINSSTYASWRKQMAQMIG